MNKIQKKVLVFLVIYIIMIFSMVLLLNIIYKDNPPLPYIIFVIILCLSLVGFIFKIEKILKLPIIEKDNNLKQEKNIVLKDKRTINTLKYFNNQEFDRIYINLNTIKIISKDNYKTKEYKNIILKDGIINIPYRVSGELYEESISSLDEKSKIIIYCIMSRHCDGILREKYLRLLIKEKQYHYLSLPFIISLLDDHVCEILEVLENEIRNIDSLLIKEFLSNNINDENSFIKNLRNHVGTQYSLYKYMYNKRYYPGFVLLKYLNKILKIQPKYEIEYKTYKVYFKLLKQNLQLSKCSNLLISINKEKIPISINHIYLNKNTKLYSFEFRVHKKEYQEKIAEISIVDIYLNDFFIYSGNIILKK